MKLKSVIRYLTFLSLNFLIFTGYIRAQFFTVAFYNVENLFDTIDDPRTNDRDFLPDADVVWNSERYDKKLKHLARVLSSIDTNELPAIIGLCEVENRNVLKDLVKQNALKKGKYEIIHYDSPDERGIDNALLYRKSAFRVISSKSVHVSLSKNTDDRTRDILYIKGVVKKSSEDTLHLFVNHWPSRGGGQEASEPNRIDAAHTLKGQVDSLFHLNNWANIIIMGDFNDEPYDRSMHEVLKAFNPTYNPNSEVTLYNMMSDAYHDGRGTIYYGKWQVFDQVILSTNLIVKEKGLVLPEFQGRIFAEDWLMYKADDGTLRPNRTAGRDYYGGYSDHLPVYVEFIIN